MIRLSNGHFYRIVAFFLLIAFGYMHSVQWMHSHQNGHTEQIHTTSFQLKKDIHCKVCDQLHRHPCQSLPSQIFTLTEVFRSKPILIQQLDLAKPFKIPLSSYFNKGPPLVF